MKLERETETCHRYGSKYRLSLFSSQLDLAPAERRWVLLKIPRCDIDGVVMMMMMREGGFY